MTDPEWDVFIAHASEDKDAFVRPLAELLERLGLRVWYDEFSLEVGDSLSRSIDRGLARSAYGIVVISPHFIRKDWPEYELRGLTAREIGGRKVILPVWHCVSRDDVLGFSPPLADKKALSSDDRSLESVAVELLGVIRPRLRDALQTIAALKRLRREETPELVPTREVKRGPIRHKNLSASLLIRIKEVHRAFADVLRMDLAETIDNFRRDLRPSDEVAHWELMASAYRDVLEQQSLSHEERRATFSALLALTSGIPPERASEIDQRLTPNVLKTAANALLDAVPQVPETTTLSGPKLLE